MARTGRPPIPWRERFWPQVGERPDGHCWEWIGATSDAGYGQIKVDGRQIAAHRASWLLNVGEIPDGLMVLHSCDNPPCVNPSHLRLGTHQENMKDMLARKRSRNQNKLKTHCPAGHPYDDVNTMWSPNGRHRFCRACRRIARRVHEPRALAPSPGWER